jgi:ribonuclease HI
MGKKQKYYVVWRGHRPGIYTSWTECQLQIKGFPDAKYKAFDRRDLAEAAFLEDSSKHIQWKRTATKPKAAAPKAANIVWESIAVDAACSGNPGVMEYQGVDTRSGERLFHKKFRLGTNNIGEFLAIVHGLAWLKQQERDHLPIYTDSATALKWIRIKKCRTQLKRTPQTEELFQIIARAENWLKNNAYKNPLLKWETESWGEIPADFGRK